MKKRTLHFPMFMKGIPTGTVLMEARELIVDPTFYADILTLAEDAPTDPPVSAIAGLLPSVMNRSIILSVSPFLSPDMYMIKDVNGGLHIMKIEVEDASWPS